MFNVQLSMFNGQLSIVQCSMVQCSMFNCQCSIVNVQCSIVKWSIVQSSNRPIVQLSRFLVKNRVGKKLQSGKNWSQKWTTERRKLCFCDERVSTNFHQELLIKPKLRGVFAKAKVFGGSSLCSQVVKS